MADDLTARIVRHIRAEGPLSIAAYMAMALHDLAAGYYARHAPIGRTGDFITAPEISQIFGELIGLWCADYWQRIGRPDPVILAELGPGRGVLTSDLLRAAATVPAFRRALRLHLVETSPVLRREQQCRLAADAPYFIESAADLPDGPLLLVANEFLDALPVRQLVRRQNDWCERLVGLDAVSRLGFVDGPPSPALGLLVPPALRQSPAGTVVEICPAALTLAAALGQRLAQAPGAALFFDYGFVDYGFADDGCSPRPPGPTLAAIRAHQPADILAAPGEADLSAHVDFAALAAAARGGGAAVYGPATQGAFLTALGAETRLQTLSARATPAQRATLEGGLRRLIDPGQMGTLFKAIAFASPGLPAPAGFNAQEPPHGD